MKQRKNKKASRQNLPTCIAVVSLPPLVGSVRARLTSSPAHTLQKIGFRFLSQLQVLFRQGYQGILLRNGGDLPCSPTETSPATLVCVSLLAGTAREWIRSQASSSPKDFQLGFQLCQEDFYSSYLIATTTGCDWVRVPFSFCSPRAEGRLSAASVLRERQRLHPSGVDSTHILVEVPFLTWLRNPGLGGILKNRLQVAGCVLIQLPEGAWGSLDIAVHLAKRWNLQLFLDWTRSPLKQSPLFIQREFPSVSGFFVSPPPSK